ncbi:MAG: hypothetical protein LHV68_05080 [Elusimicrobia bacterium]|nr:hypothetical protein [Candidatus Liberimonas magnetica]
MEVDGLFTLLLKWFVIADIIVLITSFIVFGETTASFLLICVLFIQIPFLAIVGLYTLIIKSQNKGD